MALTGPQKVAVAEITYEKYEKIEDLAASLNADQEASIADDIDTWEAIRDSHVKLQGGSDGIDFDNERKREAIRRRIRIALGLSMVASAICPTPRVFAGGISLSDMASRRADSDRSPSSFTVDLHR